MFEPVQKCENNAISKQNYTLKLFIAVKMTYCCCLSLEGNLKFSIFPLKKVLEPKKAVGHKAYSEKGIKECQTQKGRLSSTRMIIFPTKTPTNFNSKILTANHG